MSSLTERITTATTKLEAAVSQIEDFALTTAAANNVRFMNGEFQVLNTDTGLWHTAWIENQNGIPLLKLADTGTA